MKKHMRCEFLYTSDGKNFPKDRKPHFVLLGRSNVGKSSLINHFFHNKNLAKTSSKPGKTRLLQFFSVDPLGYFVDMPGFGYAKASKKERDFWQRMVEQYLQNCEDRASFVHLIDSRHPISKKDQDCIQWVHSLGKKVLFVFTKTDKISEKNKKQLLDSLNTYTKDPQVVFYTIKNRDCCVKLKDKLQGLTDGLFEK